jgi:hypothetical protein
VTYAEAADQVARLAGGLAELGLSRGKPLLILARNGIDHALIGYAAMSLGAPIAPVSPQYGLKGADLTRLAFAVERLKPAAVYVDDAEAFADALAAPFLAGLPVVASRNARQGDMAFETLLDPIPSRSVCRPGDVAKLLLTSGSTGRPKAVICTHANIALNAAQIAACYEDPDPPVLVNSAPWSHSLGANAILHMVLHRGGTLYIDAGQPLAGGRFDETVRNLREVAPTYHNMVPAGWGLLVGELERDHGPGGPVLREGAGAAVRRGVDGPVDPGPGPGRGPAHDRLPGDLRGRLRRHRDRPDRLQHPLAERPLGHGRPAHAGHGGQAGPGRRRSARQVRDPREGAAGLARLSGHARGLGGGVRRGRLLPPGRRGQAGRPAGPRGGPGVRRAAGRELQAGQRHVRGGRGPAGGGGLGDRRGGRRTRWSVARDGTAWG